MGRDSPTVHEFKTWRVLESSWSFYGHNFVPDLTWQLLQFHFRIALHDYFNTFQR